MSLEVVAKKALKKYGGKSGPGENMEAIAASIARWTHFNYKDALQALTKLTKKKLVSISNPKY
ncbi:MAG: hypothetical protein JKY15_02070 [Deltaproteobacteria bacterium]|nr:hypothetical protein [Deltaproteobacteria bacterium]